MSKQSVKKAVVHLGVAGMVGGVLLAGLTWVSIYKLWGMGEAFILGIPGECFKRLVGISNNASGFSSSNTYYVCFNGLLGAVLSMVVWCLWKLAVKDFSEEQ